MRFTIKYKLFLTLLAATVVVVASMVSLVKWSFERGFLEYVNKVEQEAHDNLLNNLTDVYTENGSWEFLRENPRQWQEIHRSSMPIPNPIQPQEGPYPEIRPRERHDLDGPHASKWRHRPPPFGQPRGGRVCLLDKNRVVVTHCRNRVDEMELRQIVVDDNTVGYLAISPRKKLSAGHDLRFSEEQHRFLVLLGLCLALISVVVAFPVSRQLVKPIKKLAEATRKLAEGSYQTRITVDSSDELGDLSRDFNTLALTLENNEKARQQWIADISHELRTPLSVLRGEIEALQDGLREMTADRLDSLHKQVMNLNRLVNDLFELSMSDIGALNYQKQTIDVAAILDCCIESLRDEYNTRQITVSFDRDSETAKVFADEERLQQLFTNLLMNSLRYTDTGGALKISLQNTENRALITMADSDPGVAESDLPRLFERLYRVENSRNRETGGTGLGLAICKNIVDAHGGSIAAESSSLGGLKITIELPKV